MLLRLLDSVSLLCQRWRHVERLESSFQRRQYGMRTANLNQSSRGKVPTFHRSLGHRLISISISHACAKQWSYPSKVKTPAFACRTDCRALLERRSAEGQILLNAGSRSIRIAMFRLSRRRKERISARAGPGPRFSQHSASAAMNRHIAE